MTHEELTTKVEALEALITAGSDFPAAETEARELLLLFPLNKGETGGLNIRTLLALSQSLWRRGMAKEALPFAEEALALAEQEGNNNLTAKVLGNIGIVYMDLSEYASALEYYSRALALDEELGNKSGMARHTGNIGVVYQNLSEYAMALEYHTHALALNEELGNKSGVAINTGNIGLVYQYVSEYAMALEYYIRALALAEELGDKHVVAINTGNIGSVYRNLSDYPRALEYYGKALTLFEEMGNKYGIAVVTGNIGNVYVHLSDYPRALEYCGKTLSLCEELGDKHGVAINTGNIGNVYANLSEYAKALEYFIRALALCEELGNKSGVAINTGNIGGVYADEKYEGYDATKAEEYLLKAMAMNEELGTKGQNVEVFKLLAALYEREKRWEAITYYKKYHEVKEEVQSEEAKKQAALMEQRRKVEESERDRQVKLARFQEQEKILHNILPSKIAQRVVDGEKTIAESFENVSVFFSDIVGFTKLSQNISAEELVQTLNRIFIEFDRLARKHGLEKIKTIGDSYMAVCGVPEANENHALNVALFALDVQQAIKQLTTSTGEHITIRIGLHCGNVVAGIIGENKFAYDLWGDAVNTASRMESHGEAGKIHVSSDFVRELTTNSEQLKVGQDGQQLITINSSLITAFPRGEMEIKGKGLMKTYFLEKP